LLEVRGSAGAGVEEVEYHRDMLFGKQIKQDWLRLAEAAKK
jgi:hypothetical protein